MLHPCWRCCIKRSNTIACARLGESQSGRWLLLTGRSPAAVALAVAHCPERAQLSPEGLLVCFATTNKLAAGHEACSMYYIVSGMGKSSPSPCCCAGSGPYPAALRALQAQPPEGASPAPAWAKRVRRCE
jgi:hypothetical protein